MLKINAEENTSCRHVPSWVAQGTQKFGAAVPALLRLTVESAQQAHLLMVPKFTIMSAMNSPTIPKTPPLAPTSARQVFSNAALKKLPAGT